MSDETLRATIHTECVALFDRARDYGLLSATAERQGRDAKADIDAATERIMAAIQQFSRGEGGGDGGEG